MHASHGSTALANINLAQKLQSSERKLYGFNDGSLFPLRMMIKFNPFTAKFIQKQISTNFQISFCEIVKNK